MKKLLRLFVLVAMGVGIVACNKEDDQNNYIGIVVTDEEDMNLVFEAEGGSETVVFTVSCDWQVSAYDEWIKLSPEQGGIYNTYFIATVEPYLGVEPRESHILVKLANGNALKIPVTQKKASLIETPDADAYTMPAEQSSITIQISTNVDFSIAISADDASWLECPASTRAMEDAELTFTARANTSNMSRVAVVNLLDEDGDIFHKFVIVQASLYEAVNEIVYHSSENRTLELDSTEGFGATLLLHFYDNNIGRIIFDDEVTAIPDATFEDCDMLDSIVLPEMVTSIGNRAFKGCATLAELPLFEGITTIGDNAFEGCGAADSVSLPASVKSIGSAILAGCGGELTINCDIPSQSATATTATHWLYGSSFDVVNVNGKIGASSFNGYAPLSRLRVMEGVTLIGSSAFEECGNLQELYIDDLAQWCSISFANAAANPMHLDIAIYVDDEPLTELMIPSNVRTIAGYAFRNAASLESITLPDNVTAIGRETFAGCSKANINIGSGITSVGTNAFDGCCGKHLRIEFNIADQPSNTTTTNHWFRGSQFQNIWFGDKVTRIGDMAFMRYDSLENIYLSNNVEYIGEGAFAECGNLSQISFGEGLTTIERYAFYGCVSLEEFSLPDGVTHINDYAFNSCEALSSITIPQSVVYIGEYLIDYCPNITAIYCKPTTPPQLADRYALSGTSLDCRIYVPEAAVADYKRADKWSYYDSKIEGYTY